MEKIDKLSAGYSPSGVIGKQGEPLSFQPDSTESKVNELVDAVNELVEDKPAVKERWFECARCGEHYLYETPPRQHICQDLKDKPERPVGDGVQEYKIPPAEPEPIDITAILSLVKYHTTGYHNLGWYQDLGRVIRYLEGKEERKRAAIKLLDSDKWSLTTLEKAIKAI